MPRRSRSSGDLIRELTADLRRSGDPVTYARLADLLREQGRLLEARSMCEQCLARYPQYATIRVALARVAEAEGDLDQAEAELRAVAVAEPHNRPVRVALGRLLLQRGATADAKRHLQHALFLSPGDAAARALLARASGQETTSGEDRGIAVEDPPSDTATAVGRALDQLDRAEGVEAVVLLDGHGLLIASRGDPGGAAEAVAALAHETWQLARPYMVQMHLGALRQATIIGAHRLFIIAPGGPGLLAVAAKPEARLGLVNLQLEAARNVLATV